jgi:hypothetical protein
LGADGRGRGGGQGDEREATEDAVSDHGAVKRRDGSSNDGQSFTPG